MAEICGHAVEIDVLEGYILNPVGFIVVFYERRAQQVWIAREMDVFEGDTIDAIARCAVVLLAEDDLKAEESCFMDVFCVMMGRCLSGAAMVRALLQAKPII